MYDERGRVVFAPREASAFLEYVRDRSELEPNTGCWLWTGAANGQGYASVLRDKRTLRVTRVLLGIEFRPDLHALHSCDTPECVNPAHLRVGNNADNVRDAVRRRRHNMVKRTHCPQGHPYAGENVRLDEKGCRRCRECQRRNDVKRNRALAGVA